MKKCIVMVITLFLLFLTPNVYGYFHLQDYDINGIVKKNGDVQIKETLTYTYDEGRNGVTRNIMIKNPDNEQYSASDIQLECVLVDGVLYSKVASANLGDSGVYELNKISQEEYQLKVYTPFKTSGVKTITYQYTLKEATVLYNDVGALWLNYVGKDMEYKIETLTIHLSFEENVPGVRYVFAHGDKYGTYEQDENSVTIKGSNILPGQAIDARIVFPPLSISDTTKVVEQDGLDSILKQEKKITDYGSIQASILFDPFIQLSILIIVVILIIVIDRHAKKKAISVPSEYEYYTQIPTDLSPAAVGDFYYTFEKNFITSETKNTVLWSTFVDLIHKKYYQLEKTLYEKKDSFLVVIPKNRPLVDKLSSQEKDVLELFDKQFDSSDSIVLEEMTTKMSKNTSLLEKITTWYNKVSQERRQLYGDLKVANIFIILITIFIWIGCYFYLILSGIFLQEAFVLMAVLCSFVLLIFLNSKKKNSIILKMVFAILTLIMILFTNKIQYMLIPYLIVILSTIAFHLMISINTFTPVQQDFLAKLNGLKRYLNDYSMLKQKDIDSVILWERYLVFAMILGVSKQAIRDICSHLVEINGTMEWSSFYAYTYFSSVNHSFNQTITSSFAATYSASTGGFSSSSGGYGGGGGGCGSF